MFKKSLLSVALLSATTFANADVLTTIKPLGFIASAITDGVTDTKVLLPVTASPHDYSLKPSDVEQLKSAQLVVWVGDEMETFLEKSVEQLPKEKVLTLEDVPAISALVEKTKKHSHHDGDHHDNDHEHHHDHDGDHHDSDHEHHHDHDGDHHDNDHEHHHDHDGDHHEGHHHHHHDKNWHVWLSPSASEQIAEQIAQRLSQQLPAQKAKIEENLAQFKVALKAKNESLKTQLATAKGKGYYTFHDAYGYFESEYGLSPLGSFTINPTVAPGAKTLNKIKKDIGEHKAQCLFTEPQFTPKVVESLSKNTQVYVGKLDPLGAKVELGKNAYPQFLQNLADEFSACFNKK